ncbi:MAG: M48 family metallopeptidase [Chloroflexota bacterium]
MANNAITSESGRVKFESIDPSAFQHPLDRQATENLKMLIGFDLLVAKFLEFGYERLLYVYNIASSVRVGPTQFPKLYAMLQESCAILDVPEPELYVQQSPVVNAFTFGYTKPYIMLYTGLLDLMDDDETMAVIAHELGHIKCGHMLYLTMANLLTILTVQITHSTFGIGVPVLLALKVALIQWQRRAELSVDRASLLVMQTPRPVLSTLTKLAGGTQKLAGELSLEAFLEQARIYEAMPDQNILDQLYRLLAETREDAHPFIVERVKELDRWSASTEYTDILAGNYPRGLRKFQIKVSAGV